MTFTPGSRNNPDVEAYFERIGYAGPRTATLETLRGIHLHHPLAIAFENLDPLLSRPMSLSAEALESKLLRAGRGGWCFEHNLLLSGVLQSLGFQVTGLAARVLWNAPEDAVRARSHMLLRIDGLAGGPFIVDVGFGGLTLTGPLRLVSGEPQATPHESFRLVGAGDEFILQALVRNAWKPVYRFDLQRQVLPDYEVWNWHLANHPESPFVNNLLAAKATRDRRYALFNNNLSIHHLHGESEHLTLTSAADLRRTLEGTMGIRLPDDPGVEAMLARLIR